MDLLDPSHYNCCKLNEDYIDVKKEKRLVLLDNKELNEYVISEILFIILNGPILRGFDLSEK